MKLINVRWKNDKVSDMQEHHASQRKANVNPDTADSESKRKLSVTDIPEAEDYHQNSDSEINSDINFRCVLNAVLCFFG